MPGPASMSHILRVNFSDLWTLTQTHRDFTCVTLAAIRFGCVCAGFCVYCLGRRARRHNIISEEEIQDYHRRWSGHVSTQIWCTKVPKHTLYIHHISPSDVQALSLSLSLSAHIWSLTTHHTSALTCLSMLPPHNLICCLRQTHHTLSMLDTNWSTIIATYTHAPEGWSKVDTGWGKNGLWREHGVHSIVRAVFFLSDSRFFLLAIFSLLLSGWLSFICVRSVSHSIMIVRALFLFRFSLFKSSSLLHCFDSHHSYLLLSPMPFVCASSLQWAGGLHFHV